MIEALEEGPDRIIIRLDPGGPIELTDLTDSFSALSRFYERHHRPDGEPAPKLYVTRLESGSVVAEIVPYAVILGGAVHMMDVALIVSDFARRLSASIKVFSDPQVRVSSPTETEVTSEDAEDIREFVKPLAGKRGANLGIRHARLKKQDGERSTVVEYTFDETEINRAVVNLDVALAKKDQIAPNTVPLPTKKFSEVMLFFDQASRQPGKERGRTGDKGIIPDISDKPLPVYFRKSFQNLKDQMVRGEVNPLRCAFVVDVHAQIVDGDPKGYIVTDVHEVISNDDSDDKPE